MSSSHDNTNITRQLKSKRDDFLLGLGLVDQMLASYKEILTNAGLSLDRKSLQLTGSVTARQNLQLQIHTMSIATQAETLLKLLSELRYNLIFSEPDEVCREVNETISQCRQLGAETESSIASIRTKVETCIDQIEEALQMPNMAAK